MDYPLFSFFTHCRKINTPVYDLTQNKFLFEKNAICYCKHPQGIQIVTQIQYIDFSVNNHRECFRLMLRVLYFLPQMNIYIYTLCIKNK